MSQVGRNTLAWHIVGYIDLLGFSDAIANPTPEVQAAVLTMLQEFKWAEQNYVGDGDSLCVCTSTDPSTWIEVRVADFYAPELHAPGGPKAKAALEQIAMGRTAQCVAGRRSYDRVVAQCSIGGTSVGELMRRAGVAEGGRGR